jgi:hypothetical protein
MSVAQFIKSHFLGKEIVVFFNETAETLTYVDRWAQNKEYFKGFVVDVEDGVLVMDVSGAGRMYVNCEHIVLFWEEPFNYLKAQSVSITGKMITSSS